MTSPAIRVLVATDLSAPARHAVERASLLAAQNGDELYLVHALQLDTLDTLRDLLGANLAPAKASLEAEANERLAQLVGDVARRRSITAQARVVSGAPLSVVATEADALNADLVVLGARGESFLRHTMLGSTSVRLLRKSVRRPVLVVKQSPHENYRTILVAIDFSPVSPQLIRAALRWAPDATLVLLHAFELPFENLLWHAGIEPQEITRLINAEIGRRRQQLLKLATDEGLTDGAFTIRVIHGHPSQQILVMEQEYDADLIVVGKHGTHITEELLLGSVTKQVLGGAQGDVLVVTSSQPHTDRS